MKKGISVPSLKKLFGVLLSIALVLFSYSEPMLSLRAIDSQVHIYEGEPYKLPKAANGFFSASREEKALEASGFKGQIGDSLNEAVLSLQGHPYEVTINLLGIIPVKRVSVHVRNEIVLIPGGASIGVTLHTRGALVVGLSSITTANGSQASPASAAGVQAGDLIEKINGIEVKDAAHLAQLCNESSDSVELTLLRNDEQIIVQMRPALDPSDGKYRMGMWVRDSTAGVGTLSFYDPIKKWYAALGHAITDVDTRASLTVRDGEIVQSSIVDIVQGTQGEPGELRGTFGATSLPLGTIETNSQYGIFGRMYKEYHNQLYPKGVPMAYPEEASVGPALILTTLSDEGVKEYNCRIIKVNPQNSPAQKGMVVEITDAKLMKTTGGIVQGMSGSPIIQNGKLIGVVTHVFINDPTKGYCMYTLWMKQQME